ncbi:arginase [Nocardioides sp. zg-1308]|uniref:arginase family protein n=1 Tax=Nocardioides sp. zg-1308 TaxID=2736253 RepID=UPI0015528301|nr:arginase family protein [Nocardioides sp. zg-1308]NPD03335.1 arginase [Nocardioides sp. zg-1308]
MANIHILGYPSSAGAYCVGVEHAPAALRDAGLVVALEAAGHQVDDLGDLPVHLWKPDQRRPLAQNLDEEVGALRALADAAAPLVTTGHRVLVLGGSCTVALGLCAAVQDAGIEPHLVYVDRHLDLNTPDSTTEGSLSWMGMAHALGLPGAAEPLVGLAGRQPLLQAAHLSYLGVDLADETTPWERDQVERLGISVTTQAEMVADPTTAALKAKGVLPDGPFVVHVDVDVLDFLDAPLAENVNGRNSGPTLVQLGAALTTLWLDPDCLGMSVGQLVPAHAASDPTSLARFVEALVPPSDG